MAAVCREASGSGEHGVGVAAHGEWQHEAAWVVVKRVVQREGIDASRLKRRQHHKALRPSQLQV